MPARTATPASHASPEDVDLLVLQIELALKAWHNIRLLSQNPLANSALVAQHLRDGSGAISRGAGLRSAIRESLERMVANAAQDGLRAESDARRQHMVLQEIYINKRPARFAQDALAVSKSSLYRIRISALQALAQAFREVDTAARAQADRASQADGSQPLLPTSVGDGALIGRDALLAWIKDRLINTGSDASRIVAVWGVPGVGKTRVLDRIANDRVVHAAFDAVLCARLGPRPNLEAILTEWMALLKPAPSSTETNTAAVIQGAISRINVLTVLDDVWSLSDALALMFGGRHGAHLICTRNPAIAVELAGDGAIQIGDLGDEDGVGLLQALAPAGVEGYEAEAFTLVKAVGGLPLALTLAGLMLRRASLGSNSRRIASAWDDLGRLDRRLHLTMPRQVTSPVGAQLAIHVSLVSVIDMSTDAVSEAARAALSSLSAFSPRPNQFGEEAALSVASCAPTVLDELTEAGLIECHPHDRYALHQSIAAYAEWRRGADMTPLQRLARYFADWCERHETEHELIEVELANVQAAASAAAECGLSDAARRIALALAAFFESRGLFVQARRALLPLARGPADADGDPLLWLGRLAWRLGDHAAAREHLNARLARGDDPIAHQVLAWVEQDAGDTRAAREHAGQAIALAFKSRDDVLLPGFVAHAMQLDGCTSVDQVGPWLDSNVVLNGVDAGVQALLKAECLLYAGDWARALRLAEDMSETPGLRARRAGCLVAIHCLAGHPREAIDATTNSMADKASPDDLARLHLWLGRAWREAGESRIAAADFEVGIRLAGTPADSAALRCELADLRLVEGRIAEARHLARSALATAQRAHFAPGTVLALAVCGRVDLQDGDFIAWRERFREAWALLAKVPSPWLAMRLLALQIEAYERHGDVEQARVSRAEFDKLQRR